MRSEKISDIEWEHSVDTGDGEVEFTTKAFTLGLEVRHYNQTIGFISWDEIDTARNQACQSPAPQLKPWSLSDDIKLSNQMDLTANYPFFTETFTITNPNSFILDGSIREELVSGQVSVRKAYVQFLVNGPRADAPYPQAPVNWLLGPVSLKLGDTVKMRFTTAGWGGCIHFLLNSTVGIVNEVSANYASKHHPSFKKKNVR